MNDSLNHPETANQNLIQLIFFRRLMVIKFLNDTTVIRVIEHDEVKYAICWDFWQIMSL